MPEVSGRTYEVFVDGKPVGLVANPNCELCHA
jgi:hypothetical protein